MTTRTRLLPAALLLVSAVAVRAAPALPAGATEDWYTRAMANIRQSEYRVTALPSDAGVCWQAPNRAQNFRISFSEQGCRVVPRTGDDTAWTWGLGLAAYGGTPASTLASAPELTVDGNRVEIHFGDITEWYVNDERGLEHGYTLQAPPQGAAANEAVVTVSVHGSLEPRVPAHGRAMDLLDASGARVVRYEGLKVTDASGRDLPARMELLPPGAGQAHRLLALRVETHDAVYPIEIDPIASSASWYADGPSLNAGLGVSVSSAGDVNGDRYSDIIAGAIGVGDGGGAFVFLGGPNGLSDTPAWQATHVTAGANFGYSVAGAGDVNHDGYDDVIVGARYAGDNIEGAAYAYYGSASGLPDSASWSVVSTQASCRFGASVACVGDVNGDHYSDVIIGAYYYDAYGTGNVGAAFAYYGSDAGLSPTSNWRAVGARASAQMGWSVGTAGDVNGDGYDDAMVGSPFYNPGAGGMGRAELFYGSADGLAAAPAWIANGTQLSAQFGRRVATAGDVNGDGYSDVLVGEPYYDDAFTSAGRAHAYYGSAAGLPAAPDRTWVGQGENNYFGMGLGSAGDIDGDGLADVIVGAYGYNTFGRIYFYQGRGAGLNTSSTATRTFTQADAEFGQAVACAGDVNGDGFSDVIVGAPEYDASTGEGQILVYHGSAYGLRSSSSWGITGAVAETDLGYAVAGAGDVNGDGYDDILVGAPGLDLATANWGRAFLFLGSATGPGAESDWSFTSDQGQSSLGYSLAGAGDVNGDGYDDLLIGAPYYDGEVVNVGRVYGFYGSATGPGDSPDWSVQGTTEHGQLGYSVAGAGDVNGDGFADVILGGPGYSYALNAEGAAFVCHGSRNGLSATPDWSFAGAMDFAGFGYSVAGADDVNGDGYSDVIIGAPWHNGANGRAQIFHGSATGLGAAADWTRESPSALAYFGQCVAGAGDVNGDSYSDIIIGAPFYASGQTREGAAYVHLGSASGVNAAHIWIREGNNEYAYLGTSVAGVGDVNADGFADVAVGAPGFFNWGYMAVYRGCSTGITAAGVWSMAGADNSALGQSVAGVGDVNGDAFPDLLAGAPGLNAAEGAAYLYMGGYASGSRPVKIAQLRTASDGRIARLGFSDSDSSFRFGMNAVSPLSRGILRFEWQAAPLGTTLGEAGTIANTSTFWYSASGPTGTYARFTVSGLAKNTLYHWRARVLYPANALGQRAGPWRAAGCRGWSEGMVRTLADSARPTVTLTSGTPNPTRAGAIPVTATFSRSVTGLSAADIVTANGVASALAGSGASYSFTLTPSGRGTVSATIPASAAVDSLGFGNLASATLSRRHIISAAPNDYDADGLSDLAVFDDNTGNWYILRANGSLILWARPWGWPGAVPKAGDYNGDRIADIAVFDDNTGFWYVQGVDGATILWARPWGWPGAKPVPGDYDGDEISDLAVFDTNAGFWYILRPDNTLILWAQPWGWPGAMPVAGDYNADGRSDLAVFDSNTGYWYIQGVDGTIILWGLAWGWPGAYPVSGDYDNDGVGDLAVFDNNTGNWYILRTNGSLILWAFPWGWPGAIPVAGDYNGDGQSDLAVFDSNTGYWYIAETDGTTLVWALPWGWPGAVPIPGACW